MDLSPYYDIAAVKEKREEVIAATDAYKSHYEEAYHILQAMHAVDTERRTIAHRAFDEAKFMHRVSGIISRELRGKAEERGKVTYAFLGGITHCGRVCRFDSVQAICPRVYELVDSYGLGAKALQVILRASVAVGQDVIACPNPDRPQELQHVLIPGKGLAFVTSKENQPFPMRPYRRIRLNAMAEEKLTHAQKAHLRFIRRISQSLEDEAIAALSAAKAAHDRLEDIYHPYVDFDGVTKLAEKEIRRLSLD
mgnify:CR=1 FL=1